MNKNTLHTEKKIDLLDVYSLKKMRLSKNKLFVFYGNGLSIKSIDLTTKDNTLKTKDLFFPITYLQHYDFSIDFDEDNIYLPSLLPGKIIYICQNSLKIKKEINVKEQIYFVKKISPKKFVTASISEGLSIYDKNSKTSTTIIPSNKEAIFFPSIYKNDLFIIKDNIILVFDLNKSNIKRKIQIPDELQSRNEKNLIILDFYSNNTQDYIVLTNKDRNFLSKVNISI